MQSHTKAAQHNTTQRKHNTIHYNTDLADCMRSSHFYFIFKIILRCYTDELFSCTRMAGVKKVIQTKMRLGFDRVSLHGRWQRMSTYLELMHCRVNLENLCRIICTV